MSENMRPEINKQSVKDLALKYAETDFEKLRQAIFEAARIVGGALVLNEGKTVTFQIKDETRFKRYPCVAAHRFSIEDVRQGKRESLILVCDTQHNIHVGGRPANLGYAEFTKADFDNLNGLQTHFMEAIKIYEGVPPELADVDRGDSWQTW